MRLVRLPERGGKEAAQARAHRRTRRATSSSSPTSARARAGRAARRSCGPSRTRRVGCVSSEDVRRPRRAARAPTFATRWRCAGSRARPRRLVGLSGSFFAARRELCAPWPTTSRATSACALEAARRGLRAVSEPARARRDSAHAATRRASGARKVRTVRRGIAVLSAYRDLLHPRYGRAALSLWGHKVARFTSPVRAAGAARRERRSRRRRARSRAVLLAAQLAALRARRARARRCPRVERSADSRACSASSCS